MSINGLLAELDSITLRIERLGKAGVAISEAQQGAYRKTRTFEYNKLRTLFRIRRAELARLLKNPQREEYCEQVVGETCSELSEDTPRCASPPDSPSSSSRSSQCGESSSDIQCKGKQPNCSVYSPSDDPLSDDADFLGQMTGMVMKVFVPPHHHSRAHISCSDDESSTTDSEPVRRGKAPSVFSKNTDNVALQLESIRTKLQGLTGSKIQGETGRIRSMVLDVSRMHKDRVDPATINQHLADIHVELDKLR